MRLKNRNLHPPGGFVFIDQDGTPIRTAGLAFDQVVDEIIKHRRNNGVIASFDPEDIAEELEAFTCQRLAHDPNWCVDDTGLYKKKADGRRLRRIASGAVRRAGKVTSFANVMMEWLGAGQKPVSQHEAERRSQICLRCPKRTKSEKLAKTVAEAIHKQTERKNHMDLHVPDEEHLQTCSACGCHLPLKIWVPEQHIVETTPKRVFQNLDPDCWILPDNRGRVLVVLPFYHGDYKAAKRLLHWIQELGGCGNRRLLLVTDAVTDKRSIMDLQFIANNSFLGGVHSLQLPISCSGWPKACGEMFIRTAEYIASQHPKMPWLWLEPDAVPLVPEWLKKLELTYFSYGTPFMGSVASNDEITHLAGVAIYPGNYGSRFKIDTRIPFDLQNMDSILPQTTQTKLIHHYWGRKDLVPTFIPFGLDKEKEGQFWPDDIHREAVLYHRVKDESLIDCLRAGRYIKHRANRDYTVVITSFRRPEWLSDCLASVLNAGVRHIVITSASPDDATLEVLEEAKQHATVLIQDEDPGNNASWLIGVDAVKTSHVHLLHEDDLLMPHFDSVVREFLNGEADMLLMDGEKHFDNKRLNSCYESLPIPGGVYSPKICLQQLMNTSKKTFSPVAGVFPTQFLRDVLAECQVHLTGKKFWHGKKSMVVGNDLLIWLRACQQLHTMKYEKRTIVSYGHHWDSISFKDAHEKESKLLPLYNAARQYFKSYAPKIHHAVQTRELPDTAEGARVRRAMETWNCFYETGLVKSVHVPDHEFSRDARNLGEQKRIPFLKDLLGHAFSKMNENDMLVLTNDDTILHPHTMWAVWEHLQKFHACCSFRLNTQEFPHLSATPGHLAKIHAQPTSGRDLFAFRYSWLKTYLEKIPDYVFGFTDWDSTLGVMIRLSLGRKVNRANWLVQDQRVDLPLGYVLHEDHKAAWTQSIDFPGNRYNRNLTKYFAQDWNLDFEPWVNP